jgi:hypothetical protein
MTADPHARPEIGGATLDHAPGVDTIHQLFGQRAGDHRLLIRWRPLWRSRRGVRPNRIETATPRGGKWAPQAVANVLRRIG